ncbi:MAG: hypothetical protein AAFQ82_14440 [Myxococcota bacterium]
MNRQIMDTLKNAEGRYLTKSEMSSMLEFANQLEARLKASEEIERCEDTIISKLMEEMTTAYPDFTNQYGRGMEAGSRDTALILRYASQALVRDDVEWLDRVILTWMNTILKGVGLTEGFIRDTYVMMERVCQSELSADTFAMLQPMIQRAQVSLPAREQAA